MTTEPPDVMRQVLSPWDQHTVEQLNDYQKFSLQHPFTCGNMKHTGAGENVLVATVDGWRCDGCDYTQGWAYAFMCNGSWREATVSVTSLLERFNQQRNR